MFRNVCFTHNNPEGLLDFDVETMEYLVYQEEIGDAGNYHFQGYCEFAARTRQARAKEILGGRTVHIGHREGTQEQAIDYCKKQFHDDGSDKRLPHTEVHEWGTPRSQGKRNDLEAFKDAVMSGARRRDLVDDHYKTLARYSRFYDTLNQMNRPVRTKELVVTLHIGPTGTGKTRTVFDRFASGTEFWNAPINNGTMWFDSYDGQSTVLFDDFAGKASHTTLSSLLRLLDQYSELVPTKGSHTWWCPEVIFVTTNIEPRDWYTWGNRGEQYWALARRFHKVYLFHMPVSDEDCGYVEPPLGVARWFEDNKPDEVDLPEH